MRPTDHTYIEIENSIIAEVIWSGDYQQVAHILKPVNFTSPFNRLVWQCFEEMYPTQPIDLLSISHKIKEKTGCDDLSGLMALLEVKVPKYASNINYYSFVILELSIKDQVIKHLTNINSTIEADDLFRLKDFKEILSYSQSEADVFNLVENVSAYLNSSEIYALEGIEFARVFKQMLTRINEVKKLSQIDSLVTNIHKLGGLPSNHITLLKELTECIKRVCTGTIDADKAGEIMNLTQKVLS